MYMKDWEKLIGKMVVKMDGSFEWMNSYNLPIGKFG